MKRLNLIRLIVSAILITSLIISNFSLVNASSFKDVNGHEFYAEAAEELSMLGILSGCGDGQFMAGRTITRAEMAKLVCALRGEFAMRDAEEMMYYDFELPFWDVDPNHWAMPYIMYAGLYGIINGYGDASFKPEAPVVYEEALKMIVCSLGLESEVFNYPDDWARGYIELAENLGITRDCYCERGWFANRGHVAVMMYNAVKFMEFGFIDDGEPATDFVYEDIYFEEEYLEDDYHGNESFEEEYPEEEYINEEVNDEPDEEPDEEPDYGTRGPGEYLLTFEKSPAGVIEADAGYYKPGDKITIRAFGNEDSRFMSWSSDCGGEFYNVFKYETTFTMPANDVVIKALYIADYGTGSNEYLNSDRLDRYDGQNINLNKYVRLTMKMIGCGSFRNLSGPYHPGTVVELKIGEGDEDIFMGWSSDDVDLPTPNSPRCKIVIPDHDVTVTATFNK